MGSLRARDSAVESLLLDGAESNLGELGGQLDVSIEILEEETAAEARENPLSEIFAVAEKSSAQDLVASGGGKKISSECLDFAKASSYLLSGCHKLKSLPHVKDIPLGCSLTDAGSESYLVKLPDHRSVSDLSVDLYGSWTVQAGKRSRNRMESRSQFFVADRTGKLHRVGAAKYSLPPDQFDIKVTQRKYRHPAAKEFSKRLHFLTFSSRVTLETKRKLAEKNGIEDSFCLISYVWECKPYAFEPLPHGNSRSATPFQRTYPSKIREIREELHSGDVLPGMVYARTNQAASVLDGRYPLETARDRKQLYNLAYGREDTRSKAGNVCSEDIEKVVKLWQDGSYGLKLDHEGGPLRMLMTIPEGLRLLADQCVRRPGKDFDAELLRPLKVDMTYGISRAYLTTFSIRDRRFEGKKGEEPLVPVAFGLTVGRTAEDYGFLACTLEEKLFAASPQLKPGCIVHCWISDSENALIAGLRKATMFRDPSQHVNCELHLRSNIDEELKGYGCAEEVRKKINNQIFGIEIPLDPEDLSKGRQRLGGILDAETKEEYGTLLGRLQPEWDQLADGFFISFVSNRSELLWDEYSLQNRSAAGLGSGRITSNDAENINRRIKGFCNDKAHAIHKLIPKLRSFQEHEFLETTRAVLGMGKFRPKAEWALLLQSGNWAQKGLKEKKKFLNDHYLYYNDKVFASCSPKMSQDVSQLGLSGPYLVKLKEAQEAAYFLIQANEFFDAPVDKTVVVIRDKALYEVKKIENSVDDSIAYKCSPGCLEYRALLYTCRHALAVAERQGKLYEHLLHVKAEKGGESLLAGIPQLRVAGAGAKPGSKRKGTATSGRSQNTTVVTTFPPPFQPIHHQSAHTVTFSADRPTDEQRRALLSPAPALFTQPYHNNNKFKVSFLPPKANRKCRGCQIELPNVSSEQLIPPTDLIITHSEPRPIRGTDGHWRYGPLYDAYLHARFSCIKNRYPYFWHGWLEVPSQVKAQLKDVHRERLLQQLTWQE